MYEKPVSYNEAVQMLHDRLDTVTAMKYQQILDAWAPEARQRAFFSARVMSATILSILHQRCEQILNGDMTEAQAVRLMQEWFLKPTGREILASMGFAPVADARGVVDLASCARLTLIFRTNALIAQECGRYRAWQDMTKQYPYGRWRCGHAEKHRSDHLRRDGKVYRFEHPIWTQSPPGGEFNCHCWRELLSESDLEHLGLTPEPQDSPFVPSSLGFDPSRPIGDTVRPAPSVLPVLAEAAMRPPEQPLPHPSLPLPRVNLPAVLDTPPPPQTNPLTSPPIPQVPLLQPGPTDTPQTMRERSVSWYQQKKEAIASWIRKHLTCVTYSPKPVPLNACDRLPPHKRIPRIDGILPEVPKEKLKDHMQKWQDGKTNISKKDRDAWRRLCRQRAERLQRGIARRAQQAFNRLPQAERDALMSYTYRDLYSINKTLYAIYRRHVLGEDNGMQLSDAQLCEIELLRRAMDKLPKFRGTVYRCMSFKSAKDKNKFLRRWQKSQDAMTGFISTTYIQENSRLYMKEGEYSVIFIIKNSTRGTYLGHLSGTPRDAEVLFDCNQRFRRLRAGENGYEPARVEGAITYVTITEVN